jgi:competence protein CoiA
MRFALRKGERVLAQKGLNGYCPICSEKLIPKCGKIKIRHWSHKSNKDCDDWYEPESEWHLNWKEQFPMECQEFIIGKHRADIRTKSRWIIELQNSPISSEQIKEREEYYKKMIWVLNGNTIGKNIEIRKKEKGFVTFKWKWFPKSWEVAKKPIYLDFGSELLLIKKLYKNKITREIEEEEYVIRTYPVSGYGIIIKKEVLINQLK